MRSAVASGRRSSGIVASAAVAVIAFLAAGASASPRLLGLELGDLGGTRADASAINDGGKVVGWAETKKSRGHAFLWSRGRMTDLGTLGGRQSVAFGINSSGQVVGSSWLRGDDRYDAVLWSNGKIVDLGTLAPTDEASDSEAFAVNDSGQVVGWSDTNFGDLAAHAFLWSVGKLIDLGTLGGEDLNSAAYDINNSGQVVGWSDVGGGGLAHAFSWSNGKMTDLGTLPNFRASSATAVNDVGQVVGMSWTLTRSGAQVGRAFLWANGKMTDLGTLGGRSSFASDINRSGQLVGASQTATGRWHAFLWTRGTMTDLGTLGARESTAGAVNALGDVVGAIQWEPRGQHPHAVLWTSAKRAGHATVPTLRGMTLAAAHDAIARAEGTFGRIRRAYSSRMKTGRVVSQSPRAGTRVLWGSKINLVVSRGRRR